MLNRLQKLAHLSILRQVHLFLTQLGIVVIVFVVVLVDVRLAVAHQRQLVTLAQFLS